MPKGNKEGTKPLKNVNTEAVSNKVFKVVNDPEKRAVNGKRQQSIEATRFKLDDLTRQYPKINEFIHRVCTKLQNLFSNVQEEQVEKATTRILSSGPLKKLNPQYLEKNANPISNDIVNALQKSKNFKKDFSISRKEAEEIATSLATKYKGLTMERSKPISTGIQKNIDKIRGNLQSQSKTHQPSHPRNPPPLPKAPPPPLPVRRNPSGREM